MRHLIILCAALWALTGCDKVREGLEERARRQAASAPATPESEAADTPEAAEARKAHFAERATVDAPDGLPRAWQAAPDRLKGKLSGASLRERIGPQGVRHVHLQVRAFDTDKAVDARLLATLKSLGLRGVPATWPERDAVEGDGWSAEVGRLKAPPGVARGHRIEIDWQAGADPKPHGECAKKVPSLKAPKPLPGWLDRATRPEEFRWRVAHEITRYPKLERVRLWMLYRNGYTQDDHVGRLQAAATAAGFTKVDGSGPTQRWANPKGESVQWAPHREGLGLPCSPVGPALAVTWERDRDDAEKADRKAAKPADGAKKRSP